MASTRKSSSVIPTNTPAVLAWLFGVLVTLLGGWVLVNQIREHYAAIEKEKVERDKKEQDEHDAKFQTKAAADKHDANDRATMKEMADSIANMANAVNRLSATAEMRQQWIVSGVATLTAKVDEQAVTQCRKDNPKNAADACRTLESAARESSQDKIDQRNKAQSLTTQVQGAQVQMPPVTVKEKP